MHEQVNEAVEAFAHLCPHALPFLQYATDAFPARQISPLLCSEDQPTVKEQLHDGEDILIGVHLRHIPCAVVTQLPL